MTITLDNMPSQHPRYQALMDTYLKLMNGIIKYQGQNGLWHQVILDADSFEETSCTAMFVYSFAGGVNKGRLEKRFATAAEKGWDGLTKKIENGLLTEVCCGTDESGSYDYYLNRPRITGDFHGMAPLLWCASELLK